MWGAYGFINGYYYDDELGSFNIEASEKIHEILKEYLKMGYTPINVKYGYHLIIHMHNVFMTY
ncbi:putative replication initiator domain protein [[Clostridium] sordellii ATCC 9714]|nr:putative replication initiator domain protein [[Clostridium] sordellii ATCC 9714] [Paeniclostridium sordellii ATCC 9714]